jgi:hypothetical protein
MEKVMEIPFARGDYTLMSLCLAELRETKSLPITRQASNVGGQNK